MRLDVDLRMDYALAPDDPALLAITAAPVQGQTVLESTLDIEDATLRWIGGESGIGRRVWAITTKPRLKLRYRARLDVTRPEVALSALDATPWDLLAGDVLTFLRPSRFCPSDQLVTFARNRFGHLEGGAKIAAIGEWTAAALAYVPGSSDALTTAVDTFLTREGVCRDYAHLVCALARAVGIPARYTTGYGPDVDPPDFHAVAEVWLGGGWHIVDATGMTTPSGLAIIGSGRDAGDVPFMETERWASMICQRITVTADVQPQPAPSIG